MHAAEGCGGHRHCLQIIYYFFPPLSRLKQHSLQSHPSLVLLMVPKAIVAIRLLCFLYCLKQNSAMLYAPSIPEIFCR